MAKKTKQVIYDEHIIENTLEEIVHSSFMTYAEYVILEPGAPRWRTASSRCSGAFCTP